MTVRSIDLQIDVTEAAGLGEPAHVALTVTAPDELRPEPVVCFAKPGGGYARGYYTAGPAGTRAGGAQADWHAERGWIFVSVDHLGVGESSQHDPERLSFAPVVAASEAAEADVRQKLAAGTLMDGLPKVERPLTIGIGQSMGGCLTVVQQGRYHGYDGIGVLGYSVLRTHPPTAPGTPPIVLPWVPRDALPSDGVFTNGPALAEIDPAAGPGADAMAWGFHYDDVDPDVVRRDLEDFPARGGDLPPWGIGHRPGDGRHVVPHAGRGAARGGGDPVPGPRGPGRARRAGRSRGEPRAYESSRSVDLFVCPRMAHMHNFAGTASCSGGASRRGRTGCGRRGTDGARPRRRPPVAADPRAGRP